MPNGDAERSGQKRQWWYIVDNDGGDKDFYGTREEAESYAYEWGFSPEGVFPGE